MKNNIVYIIVFIVCLLLSTFFLMGKGVWAYVDMNMFPFWNVSGNGLFYGLFSVLSTPVSNLGVSTYFGFDFSQRMSGLYFAQLFPSLFVHIFGLQFGYIFTVILYFILLFFSGYSFFSLFSLGKKGKFIGSLFLAFNPFSFGLLNELSFLLSIPFLFLLPYSIIKIFEKGNLRYFLLFSISVLLLPAYTRILGLFIVIFFVIFILTLADHFKIYIKEYKKIFYMICLGIFLNIPYIYSFLSTGGMDNGIGGYLTYNWTSYYSMKEQGLLPLFSFQSVPTNLVSNYIFESISGIIVLFLFILFAFSYNNTLYRKILLFLGIFFLFIKGLPFFVNVSFYDNITVKYIPFLAYEHRWINILFIFWISLIIAILINDKKKSYAIYLSVFFIVITSLIIFKNNYTKSDLLNADQIPENYKNIFFSGDIGKKSTIFFPQEGWGKFKWSPYLISLGNNSSFQEVFSSNRRFVSIKSEEMRSYLLNVENISKNFLFNVKNIFLFKDIEEVNEEHFGFFSTKNILKNNKEKYDILLKNINLYIKDDNENFAHFGLKNDDKYEYFLYSPAKIEKYSIDGFFSDKNSINIFEKPVNIDPSSFNKPDEINNFVIPEENKNISMRYKKSDLQPTKIYAKFGNIDTSKPFLVQLNQTFGMSWKLKFITKEEFEEKKCEDEYQEFEITQNKVCNYKAQILDLADTKFLNNPEVPRSEHFEGNFVGNAWLVKPEDIPENMKNSDELYAVIIHEKQIWYNWALLVSGLTFGFLLILTIFQEIKNFKNRKNEK